MGQVLKFFRLIFFLLSNLNFRQKQVPWCLNNGVEWIFGILEKTNNGHYSCHRLAHALPLNGVIETLKLVMKVLVIWVWIIYLNLKTDILCLNFRWESQPTKLHRCWKEQSAATRRWLKQYQEAIKLGVVNWMYVTRIKNWNFSHSWDPTALQGFWNREVVQPQRTSSRIEPAMPLPRSIRI